MTTRPEGHIYGQSPHPNKSYLPDIPGHKNNEKVVVRGKLQKETLETRIEALTEEIFGSKSK